jgi:hypothetical protein
VRSKNFAAVSRPSSGLYCLTPAGGIDPASTAAAVSPERSRSAASNLLLAYLDTSGTDCDVGEFEVATYTLSLASLVLSADLSNGVAFTVLVP